MESVAVTPLAGVWIEIFRDVRSWFVEIVTPLAGVWIEIRMLYFVILTQIVTPLAGVWIEIDRWEVSK